MKKVITKIFILIMICAVLIFPLNYLFTTYNGRYMYRAMNEMYDSKENIDVLFLGSSHCYKSLDPDLADSLLGENAFNAGSSVQGMNTSYYLLKEITEYHKLKTVYLDTNFAVYRVKEDDANIFTVSDFMRNGKNKYELLKNGGGVESIFNGYITIRRNYTNINIISNLLSRTKPISDYSGITYENEEYRGDGFVYVSECKPVTESDLRSCELTDLSGEVPVCKNYDTYLKKIIKLCKEKNIELILIDHPMRSIVLDTLQDYNNYTQYFVKIAKRFNIQYWNFNLYKGDNGFYEKDYSDYYHLNGEGAEKYTKLLCSTAKRYNNGEKSEDMFYNSYNEVKSVNK